MLAQIEILRSASPSNGSGTALLALQVVCNRAMLEFALWPLLASSFMACARQLRRPIGIETDELLLTIADSAELVNEQMRIATLAPCDDAVRFMAERSMEALQRLVLTALGVLQGKILIFRPNSPPTTVG